MPKRFSPTNKPAVPKPARASGAVKLWKRLAEALQTRPDAQHLRASLEHVQAQLAEGKQAALARQQLLEAVVDTTPIAITLVNQLGQIVFVNACAREQFFDNAAPEGKNLLRMLASVPAPLRNVLLCDADRLFTHETSAGPETYHLSKRSLTLGAKPHSLLLVRRMTLELSTAQRA